MRACPANSIFRDALDLLPLAIQDRRSATGRRLLHRRGVSDAPRRRMSRATVADSAVNRV
jgi:hypothetical protein